MENTASPAKDAAKVGAVIVSFIIVLYFTITIAVSQAVGAGASEPVRAETFAESIEVCSTVYGHDNAQLRACIEASLATDWAK